MYVFEIIAGHVQERNYSARARHSLGSRESSYSSVLAVDSSAAAARHLTYIRIARDVPRGAYFTSPASPMCRTVASPPRTIGSLVLSAGILAFVEGRTGGEEKETAATIAGEKARKIATARPIGTRWRESSTPRAIEREADQMKTIQVTLSGESFACARNSRRLAEGQSKSSPKWRRSATHPALLCSDGTAR